MARRRQAHSAGRAIAFCAVFLALAACAGGPVYRPASSEGAVGYTDMPLSGGHYLVTFTGSQNMDLEEVRQYLRRREAELTLHEGYSHFVVFTSRSEADVRMVPSSDFWNPENGYLAGYITRDGSPSMSGETGARRPWVGDANKTTRYSVISEIVLLKPAEAAKNSDAQSARRVLDRYASESAP